MLARGKLRFAATSIVTAMVMAGLALSPPRAEAVPVNPSVVLYEMTHYASEYPHRVITHSEPDLGSFGWSHRVSSLEILGGISIAVYSEINYRGTCSTFIGHDPLLANDLIGDDRIASVKFFSSCAGPVVDPVVTNITAVSGGFDGILCPPGYVKRDTDLNAGTDGDIIHLCFHVESSTVAGDNSVGRVDTSADWLPYNAHCGDGREVPTDLNEGAGGMTVHLCYWTLANPGRNHDPGERLRDLEFVSAERSLDNDELASMCHAAFADVAAGNVVRGAASAVGDDLNIGASGRYIYTCALNYDANLAGPPDLTPPRIDFVGQTPEPNAAGWNNASVTLTWRCSDDRGVVSEIAKSEVSVEGANQSVTGTCEDPAGNVATDTRTGINVDLTPPLASRDSRTPPSNPNGWNNTDVRVTWNCKDSLSGPVHPTEIVQLTTEGPNQSATGSCADLAGNTTVDTVTGIDIDKTRPALSGSLTPAPNAFGWFRSDATAAWTCSDEGGSGLDQPCPATSTITGEGVGLRATASVSDRAGNSSLASVVANIDRTPPTISGGSLVPAANPRGWNNDDVTVTWRCSDALSGAQSSSVSDRVSGEGRNLTANGTCRDKADNVASDSVTGINIDRTAPQLNVITTTADRQPYRPGTWTYQDVTVMFHCTDELSGVASVSDPTTVSTTGADQSVDGVCVDNAGNTTHARVGNIMIDKTPPTMVCSVTPDALWPPNHRLVRVAVTIRTSDDLSGPGDFALTGATSSEPDNGRGDGNTTGDIRWFQIGTPDTDGLLRAERSGPGNGRDYTLTYQVRDAATNSASCKVTVTVPHDGGP